MRGEHPCGNRIGYFVEFESGRGFPLRFGSVTLAKAGQLAIDYACDVAPIPDKLRNFFPRANQRSPSVTRTWILLNPAHVMSFK